MSTVTLSSYVAAYTMTNPVDTLSIAGTGSVGAGGVASDIVNTYTVINSGHIGVASGTGVLIYRGGTVINNLGATIAGDVTGVSLGVGYEGQGTHTSFGSVVNDGSIVGGSGDGLYLGYNLLQGAFVTNGDSIDTGALISGANGIRNPAGIFTTIATTIDNFGTIRGTGGAGYAGIVMDQGTPGTIVNGSSLDTLALIGGFVGIDGTTDGTMTVQNFGTIQGTGGTAVRLGSAADRLIDEAGAVFIGTVQGAGGALELAGDAGVGTLAGLGTAFTNFAEIAIDAAASWTLTGSNTIASGATLTDDGTLVDAGTILGDITLGAGAAPLSIAAGAYLSNNGTGSAVYSDAAASIVNRGTIQVSAPGASVAGYYGIKLRSGGSIDNIGTVTGDNLAALRVYPGGSVTNTGLLSSGRAGVFGDFGVNVTNTGTIHGPINGILARNGTATIANSGTIYGNNAIWVLNGTGTITNSGTLQGVADRAVSLTAGGTLTNQAGGLITAPTDNVGVYVGGAAYTGTAVGVITNAGTITGGTGVAFYAGDTLGQTVIDSGTIIGSSGTAVAFSAGDDLLQFTPSTSVAIQGVVDGGGGTNTLEFASGATTGTLTGLGADFIDFSVGTVDAGASWLLEGSNTLGAGDTLTNSGTLTDAGTLTNTGSLLVDAPIRVMGTLINSSIVTASGGNDAVYVANSGVVTNTAGGTITGGTVAVTAAGIATIDNFGTIEATSVFAAIAMASGTVVNGGASNTAASILGSTYGVEAAGVATVTNYGTITANHQEGVGLKAGGSLDNLGVINANEYGVLLYGPGMATNSGTIFAFGGGIVTDYAGDVVVNSGTITGSAGGGIILQAGGTVIDSGTISAGYFAVLFRGTVSNLLVLENGYKLSGPVGGSASASSNAVELLGTSAANAVTANFNGLDLTRIGTIAFAPGNSNYATLRITNSATLPGTIANFVGPHDTIDLTTLSDTDNNAVTSFNSVTDQLTVTAGTASVVLQLDSENYSGLAFVAQQDGSGGTEITPTPLAGPPAISGTEAGQTTGDDATIQPFASAAITDPNGTLTETVTVALSGGDADGLLSGSGLTETAPGLYSFTASDAAAATTALKSLVFTPTPHQVAPGGIVSTTFTINVTDGIDQSASDGTTSVVVTAEASLPTISGALGGMGVPDQAAATPFASATITDVNFGATDTATVSFDPSGAVFSNLGGGSINNGTYTVTGTPAQVTAALDALTFTPAAPGSGFVATTDFALAVSGAGGTVSNDAASVTTVTQVLGLATVPTGQITIAVSPDGSSFPGPATGLTNEAVVTSPVTSASYTLPSGYQAEYLGGSADATLTDMAVGGAILVGNTGNDTLVAAAANDSIVAGDGDNSIVGGSGQIAIEAGNGNDLISLPADADYAVSTGGGSDTIFAAGSGTVSGGTGSNVFVALGGANVIQSQGADFISAAGSTTVQAGGNGAGILGGDSGGMLLATVTGAGATVSAASDAATIFSSGDNAMLLGGAQTTEIAADGQADTIAGGAGMTNVTLAGNNDVLLGGAGSLSAVVQGAAATIGGSAGAATITVLGDALMFGNSGTLQFAGGSGTSTVVAGTGAETVSGGAVLFGNAGSNIDYVGSSGGAQFLAGSGNEMVDASGSDTGNIFWGSANTAASAVMLGGAGADTLVGGAGAATLGGGGGANTFVFFASDGGANDLITDFTASDQVILSGYDVNEAGTTLQTAVSSGGSTTLTLSDSTRITFLDVASGGSLQGHVI